MRTSVGLGLFLLCIPSITMAAPDVKSGVDAWGRGDFAAAAAIWKPRAIAGDPDAQFNLALAYRTGRGVPLDVKQAETWYRRAADQGHIRAADNLGLLLFQNGDHAGAMPLVQASAKRGEPRAEFVLGTALFNGDYVEKNWPLAYAHMIRAAATGLPQAQESLRQMETALSPGEKEAGRALAQEMPFLASLNTAPPPTPTASIIGPAVTKTAPPPHPASTASPSKPAESGKPAWRVQFGAFSQRGGAQRLWQERLSKLYALTGIQPDIAFDGKLFRLQAGPLLSKAKADDLCRQVRTALLSCLVVPPAP